MQFVLIPVLIDLRLGKDRGSCWEKWFGFVRIWVRIWSITANFVIFVIRTTHCDCLELGSTIYARI